MDLRLEDEDSKSTAGPSWAEASRRLRQAMARLSEIGDGKDKRQRHCKMWPRAQHHQAPDQWHIEERTWQQAWKGANSFWKTAQKLYRAGIRSPTQLPFQLIEGTELERKQSATVPKALRHTQETDGKQVGRPMLMQLRTILTKQERQDLQGFLDMIDWKGQGVTFGAGDRGSPIVCSVSIRRCAECAKETGTQHQSGADDPMHTDSAASDDDPATRTRTVWHLQGKLCATCRMQRNRTSIPAWLEIITKKQAEMSIPRHTAESAWRRLCQAEQDSGDTEGGNAAWRQAAQEVGYAGAFGVTEVLKGMVRWIRHRADTSSNAWDTSRKEDCAREIWRHIDEVLHPFWKKHWGGKWTAIGHERRDSSKTPESHATPMETLPLCDKICTLLQLCDHCQCVSNRHCACCKLPWCERCAPPEQPCEGCGQPRPHSRKKKRSRKVHEAVGRLLGRNVHNVGRDFIEKVVDARWRSNRDAITNDEALAEDLEFRCHLRGWDQSEREQRIDKLLSKHLLSDGTKPSASRLTQS